MDWLYHPPLHFSNNWIAFRCYIPKCRCVLYIVFVVFVHPLLPSGVLLQQWHKINVDVGKSDCREPLFEVMAKFMLGTSQVWWKRFAIHQSGQKRWAILSQHGYTEGFLYSSSDHSSPAHSSALLALKQKAGITTSLYTRRWDCRWVQNMWPVPVHLYWYLPRFIVGCRFKIYHRTSSFVGLGVAIKKVGLVDSIHVSKRKSLHIAEKINR